MSRAEQVIRGEAGRWVAGVSGNPNGAPKRPSIVVVLKAKVMAQADRKRRKGHPVSEALVIDQVVNEWIHLALDSDDERVRMAAIKEMIDRLDGKPNQSVTLTDATTDQFRENVMRLLSEWQRAGLSGDEEQAARMLSEPVIETTAEVVE